VAAGSLALGNMIGNKVGGPKGAAAGALAGAATGAMIGSVFPVVGTAIGAVIGGAAGLIGGIFGGRKKAAAAKKLAQDAAGFMESLNARALAAAGDEFGARKAQLEMEQKREREEAIAKFGAASREVARLIGVQTAELAALSGSMSPGTYLSPSGFSANPFRFDAGRPAAAGTTVTGNAITFVLPDGTTQQQAEKIVRALGSMATAQGMPSNRWSQVQVQ
jgi:phage tail tape-measure protein